MPSQLDRADLQPTRGERVLASLPVCLVAGQCRFYRVVPGIGQSSSLGFFDGIPGPEYSVIRFVAELSRSLDPDTVAGFVRDYLRNGNAGEKAI